MDLALLVTKVIHFVYLVFYLISMDQTLFRGELSVNLLVKLLNNELRSYRTSYDCSKFFFPYFLLPLDQTVLFLGAT